MWKCPKCDRTFRTINQQHFCGRAPETIDEYIVEQEKGVQPILNKVRNIIRDTLPDTVEKISWRMPTWWKGRNIIQFAAQKNHLGIYPGPEAVDAFSEELTALGLKYSKGSIQIPYKCELPVDLIRRIAKWCIEEQK